MDLKRKSSASLAARGKRNVSSSITRRKTAWTWPNPKHKKDISDPSVNNGKKDGSTTASHNNSSSPENSKTTIEIIDLMGDDNSVDDSTRNDDDDDELIPADNDQDSVLLDHCTNNSKTAKPKAVTPETKIGGHASVNFNEKSALHENSDGDHSSHIQRAKGISQSNIPSKKNCKTSSSVIDLTNNCEGSCDEASEDDSIIEISTVPNNTECTICSEEGDGKFVLF